VGDDRMLKTFSFLKKILAFKEPKDKDAHILKLI